jgi:hypothetical protein
MAVLLPLRGAMAAAVMCPVAGTGVQAEVLVAEQAHDHTHAHAHTVSDDAGHELASQHADHHDFAGAGDPADKCNLCSAFCSVTGLVSGFAPIAEPLPLGTIFPHPAAAPASFIPDGHERPPRSI